jgi:hypothetical protein
MPKFACVCGHVINLSTGRSESELALISERRIEEIADLLDENVKLSAEQFYNLIDETRNTVYRCPGCRRLHVEDPDRSNCFETFIVERAAPSPLETGP